MKKTIAVIGGTGKAGQFLIRQLLSEGYALRLLVRHPDKLYAQQPSLLHPSPTVSVIRGDVQDLHAVSAWLQGSDAVISTQGSALPPNFSSATANILAAMKTYHLARYIVVTGLSIDIPGDDKSEWCRQASAFMRQQYPDTIADKQQEYSLLSRSEANWTLVRIPLLEQTPGTGAVSASLRDCSAPRIRAGDLAVFLTGQLEDSTYIRKAPFVASIETP
ncbi:NAD(P)-dependent oxidoreductase [Chitinophaga varians]|uniref:NAD(P)-dependent oxidoreductase n=1 Tax=Chitinophaga varians TaxID=2202339 RepID=UPI00165F26ED|nr:NAD(P)H-binding protein [Chitinophaga varians]MBC9914855.1 NAD(P)H-binding protein [Chitinophaga varians]